MKEHPILFSDEMVRAILDGRKTQTRRVRKHLEACPYGKPGDHLWVKENWGLTEMPIGNLMLARVPFKVSPLPAEENYAASVYRAHDFSGWDHPYPTPCSNDYNFYGWKSSRYMPRWASRVTLEIIAVRIQQVQSISREDIEAEGTPPNPMEQVSYRNDYWHRWRDFEWLWNKINAKRGYSFESNPWVFVIEFKHVSPLP